MRLTGKTSDGTYFVKSNGLYGGSVGAYTTQSRTPEMIAKLGELEDFMEEQGFESLEELKINIEYLKDKIETDKFNYEQLHKFKNHLQQENQALKNRWEKLKDYVNTPKEFQEWNENFEITVDSIKNKMKELEEK